VLAASRLLVGNPSYNSSYAGGLEEAGSSTTDRQASEATALYR
jgi:hypothetical protein